MFTVITAEVLEEHHKYLVVKVELFNKPSRTIKIPKHSISPKSPVLHEGQYGEMLVKESFADGADLLE